MSDTARTVLAGLGSVRSDLEDLYQDLHRHPELGLREHRTAKKAAESLRRSGYDVTEGVGGTGVIGVLANGDGRWSWPAPTWTPSRCASGPASRTPPPRR